MSEAELLAEQVRNRLAGIRSRVDAVSEGRPVTVVAVTKGFGPEYVQAAFDAGLSDFGENYAQELVQKSEWFEDRLGQDGAAPLKWHFIGGLQSNKVKRLDGLVAVWQTIDRLKLLDAVAGRSADAQVLIQVNTTGEPQKSGCDPAMTAQLVDHALSIGLDVQGLMTVGATDGQDPRPAFELLRTLAESNDLNELSMGMSNDFETAVEAGSTMIRIGSALFGPRPPRP